MVERSVRLKLDDVRRPLEERLGEHVLEKLPADADVRFAPAGLGVGAVAMPLARMQDDDCSALHGYALPAFELDDALAAADVEKLVFPVGEGASVLLCMSVKVKGT